MNVKPKLVMNALAVSLFALALPAPEALAGGKPACAAYLTEAEVEGALGLDMEATEPVEYSEGFTVCSWVKDRPVEGQLGINLSFFEMKAIRDRFDKAAAYLGIEGGFDGFRSFVQEFNDQLGIPRRLSDVGVTEDRIDELAAMAITDPSCGGNPVELTVDNLKELFRACI